MNDSAPKVINRSAYRQRAREADAELALAPLHAQGLHMMLLLGPDVLYIDDPTTGWKGYGLERAGEGSLSHVSAYFAALASACDPAELLEGVLFVAGASVERVLLLRAASLEESAREHARRLRSRHGRRLTRRQADHLAATLEALLDRSRQLVRGIQ